MEGNGQAAAFKVEVKSTFLHVTFEQPAWSGRRSRSLPPSQRASDAGASHSGPSELLSTYVEDIGSQTGWRKASIRSTSGGDHNDAKVPGTPSTVSESGGSFEWDSSAEPSDGDCCLEAASPVSGTDDVGKIGKKATPSDGDCCLEAASPVFGALGAGEIGKKAESQHDFASKDGRTTVRMRNIPNAYTRDVLQCLIDTSGFAGTYNFIYLPMDFSTVASMGYAFINFVSTHHAERFHAQFSGFKQWNVSTAKVCSVDWANADQQGLEANIERYRNSSVMHKSVPDEFKPIRLVDGVRCKLPRSTKRLWPPHAAFGSRANGRKLW